MLGHGRVATVILYEDNWIDSWTSGSQKISPECELYVSYLIQQSKVFRIKAPYPLSWRLLVFILVEPHFPGGQLTMLQKLPQSTFRWCLLSFK